MDIEDLKNKLPLTRTDIEELLKSIGKPGENQEEKIAAIKSLNRNNRQGHDLSETLGSYQEF